MNKLHRELVEQIKLAAKKVDREPPKGYLGSGHKNYGLSNPQKREIAKAWKKDNKDISIDDFIELVDELFQGESYDEKTLAGMLLGYMPNQRKKISPAKLDSWLEKLEGWAEIDGLCQSTFTAQELLDNWQEWKKWLKKFNQSKHISKRRASLVLLVKPVRDSEDTRLTDLAFKNIDKLKSEDDKLITKAISWLLREMTKRHHQLVKDYLDENEDSLPAIAVRETCRKLETGKK
jgi:3-methyladenine DNA glycosylase AlkD